MTDSREARLTHAKKRLAIVLAGGLAGVVSGLAGVYGIGRLAGNAPVAPECRPAQETAKRIAPLIRGEVAALTVAKTPKRPPDLAFNDEHGTRNVRAAIAAHWKGQRGR